MPTTLNIWWFVAFPKMIVWSTESSWGQKRIAMLRLMTATAGASPSSCKPKSRPLTSGILNVVKKPALAGSTIKVKKSLTSRA